MQINNTYNIYLNENTDLYKILDEYEIENKSKIAKLVEIQGTPLLNPVITDQKKGVMGKSVPQEIQ